MFEKEAEEYREKGKSEGYYLVSQEMEQEELDYIIDESFKDGAEFGYNKANEWHYVKDGDLPTKELEEKQLLIRVRNYTEDYIFAYYMLDKYYSKNGKSFYYDTYCDIPIDIKNIIAWKEIVFPKESE